MVEKTIEEINKELRLYGVPIEIINKNTLKVKANDEEYKITRADVKNFSLSSGSGLATFGRISGDWRMINTIVSDCQDVFNRIDEVLANKNKNKGNIK